MKNIDFNKIKTWYFATVCLPVPLYGIYQILGGSVNFLEAIESVLFNYFIIGTILVLVDLWRSNKDSDSKLWWSLTIIIFSAIVLPIYWFKSFVKNERTGPTN